MEEAQPITHFKPLSCQSYGERDNDRIVNATLPFLLPPVAAMVKLQRLTGCRPGEICVVRPCDIELTSDVWCYRPESHKLEHRDLERRIYFGPKSQQILLPWMQRAAETYCFSPVEAMLHLRETKASRRKTPLAFGNRVGTNRKESPARAPGDRYSTSSYRRAIERACALAFPMPTEYSLQDSDLSEAEMAKRQQLATAWKSAHNWHPNQLRHTRATELRRLHGLDAAQVVLGHSEAFVTQLYAERDFQKAEDIMRQFG